MRQSLDATGSRYTKLESTNASQGRNIDMSKVPADLKYPMVDLFTDVTMSFMYLNMLTASNLLLLSAPWLFTQAWMKGLESGRVAAPEQEEPLSDNRQTDPP
jgi:hypothetical protein